MGLNCNERWKHTEKMKMKGQVIKHECNKHGFGLLPVCMCYNAVKQYNILEDLFLSYFIVFNHCEL